MQRSKPLCGLKKYSAACFCTTPVGCLYGQPTAKRSKVQTRLAEVCPVTHPKTDLPTLDTAPQWA